MTLCNTCGNELPNDVLICPFCETSQSTAPFDPGFHEPEKSGPRHESGSQQGSDKDHVAVDKHGIGSQHGTGSQSGPGSQPGPGSPRTSGGQPDSALQKVMVVNLEAGMPVVRDALTVLNMKLREAHNEQYRMIKVIHGWGSSGEGGRIKAALPAHLEKLKQERTIRSYLPGEEYSNTTPRGRHLLSKYPELKSTIRPDRRNPGITLLEL